MGNRSEPSPDKSFRQAASTSKQIYKSIFLLCHFLYLNLLLTIFYLSSSYRLATVLLSSSFRLPTLRSSYTIRMIAEHYPKKPKGGPKDHLRRTKGEFVFIALIFFRFTLPPYLISSTNLSKSERKVWS